MTVQLMQPAIRLRTVVALVLCWAVANLILYCVLETWNSVSSSEKCQPSVLARTLFRPIVTSQRSSSQNNFLGDRSRWMVPSRLLYPMNIVAHERYPLVLFLHGSGQRGDNNSDQLFGLPEQMVEPPWRSRFNCFLLAPQCPTESNWSSVNDELVSMIRDLIKREPIDPQRIYLTGLSMGGFGSWELAAKERDLFAAVVPICGGGDPTTSDRLINTAIWAVHGDADKTVPVQKSREMIESIRLAGGLPKYTELKDVGHDSWSTTYREADGVLKWMFEQRNTKPAALSR